MDQFTRKGSFRGPENRHRQPTRIFDRPPRQEGNDFVAAAEWAPTVDIVEDEQNYLVKAEVPDMKNENIHVSVENGLLTLSGERKFEKEEKNRRYHRTERCYGAFARSFNLPDNVDPEKVSASCKDGMLTVWIAKSDKAKPLP
jgi:HSP20 family protein